MRTIKIKLLSIISIYGIDGAHLDNFTITVSPARGVDSRCGNESWSATVLPVSN